MLKPNAELFKIAAACLFCAAQIFIYVVAVILGSPAGALSAVALEYLSIVLCFAFSLLFLRNKRGRLTAAALLFTAAADYFLVVLDDFYTVAVTLFIIVQLIHMLNVHSGGGAQELAASAALRAAAAAAAEITLAIVLGGAFGLLYALAAFCFVNLVFNAFYASIRFKRNPLLAAGLALFTGCDIFVGLGFIGATPAALSAVNMIWLFYLPSQVLIALNVACIKNSVSGKATP